MNAPASNVSWTSVLDDYERALDGYERAIGHHGAASTTSAAQIDVTRLVVFAPPSGLEPLPAAMRPRAESLSARTERICDRVARLADDLEPQSSAVRRRPARGATSASMFDQHG